MPVIQTSNELIVSKFKYYAISVILNQTPSHTHIHFSDRERRSFIKNNYSAFLFSAYESVLPGAYKADLFRYLYAYLNACIYLDDKFLLTHPISNLYKYTIDGSIFVKEVFQSAIYNALFVVFENKKEIIRDAILIATDNIFRQNYGSDALSVTGPRVLGEAWQKNSTSNIFLTKIDGSNWQDAQIINSDGRVYGICSYFNYYNESNYISTSHYGALWKKRSVFGSKVKYPDIAPIIEGIDHVLWINLKRASERRKNIETLLSNIDTSMHTKINAIDGKVSVPLSIESARDDNTTPFEECCTLSHLLAIYDASQHSGDNFLILEDDIAPRYFPFLSNDDRVSEILKRAPKDWEIIQVGWTFSTGLIAEFTDWNACFRDKIHIAGTLAYIINKRGINKLVNHFRMSKDGIFTIRSEHKHLSDVVPGSKWFLSDVFIFSNVKTYTYKNKLFATTNADSFIHEEHINWHDYAQGILFNNYDFDQVFVRI